MGSNSWGIEQLGTTSCVPFYLPALGVGQAVPDKHSEENIQLTSGTA